VRRPQVDALLRADLDDLAQVHHRDPVADVVDDPQIVGDEQVGDPQVTPQLVEQVQDLRPDRHVQSGHGLVADDQPRAYGQRASDADALPLPSGELVRIPVGVLGTQADAVQQAPYLLLPPIPRHDPRMDPPRLLDQGGDGHPRVE
jgi:hypothetical protein